MARTVCLVLLGFALLAPAAVYGQNAKQFIQQAVQTELQADRNDHTHWLYFEDDRRPDRSVKQWMAETRDGNLQRIVQMNGQPVAPAEQRRKMDSFVRDPGTRLKQRKGEQHDDQQAEELLNLLPQAFLWTAMGKQGSNTVFHFRPDPQFRPPDFEAKVFSAMEGDMAVDTVQLRIVSLKGRMISDVTILGGLLGRLNAGGTFDVERRETGKHLWQIVETHVHIQGHALIFKTISEQEDDVKSHFVMLPPDISLPQAEAQLLRQTN